MQSLNALITHNLLLKVDQRRLFSSDVKHPKNVQGRQFIPHFKLARLYIFFRAL